MLSSTKPRILFIVLRANIIMILSVKLKLTQNKYTNLKLISPKYWVYSHLNCCVTADILVLIQNLICPINVKVSDLCLALSRFLYF